MAVDDPSVIDVIGRDPQTGRVVLTVSDHLPWDDLEAHQQVLVRKVAAYLDFVRSGQLEEMRPGSSERGIEIGLVFEHEPPAQAEPVLAAINSRLQDEGLVLSYETLPRGY